MTFKILYIFPFDFWDKNYNSFLTGIIRLSNYLNSKKNELDDDIEEEYFDLRYEKLPEFHPETIKDYRIKLAILLNKIFSRFSFNLAAISCYSSFNYLNSVELAYIIKKE